MSGAPDLRLAVLLAARLCHELIGPITAVANGLELLEDENDGALAADALALASDSARQAAARLQFYRFAYGFGGEAAAGPPPGELAARYFEATPIACDYSQDARRLPSTRQQLGCNLLLLGAAALTRGGRLRLDAVAAGLRLEATGANASLTAEELAALRLEAPLGQLSPRSVQGYFTGCLAQAQGWRLNAEAAPGRLALMTVALAHAELG